MNINTDALFFISDLHLDPHQPDITQAFHDLLEKIKQHPAATKALFILGDLFEAWIGDDAIDVSLWLQTTLKPLKELGIKTYFVHGNRDFLINKGFEDYCDIENLEEVTQVNYKGFNLLLCHGDHLCTQDVEYMKFRTMVRNKEWQAHLLSKTIEERTAIAQQIRDQSKEANSTKEMDILDVDPLTLKAFMQQHQADALIHGHTHRPAVHQDIYPRIVLSDWHPEASWLELHAKDEKLIGKLVTQDWSEDILIEK